MWGEAGYLFVFIVFLQSRVVEDQSDIVVGELVMENANTCSRQCRCARVPCPAGFLQAASSHKSISVWVILCGMPWFEFRDHIGGEAGLWWPWPRSLVLELELQLRRVIGVPLPVLVCNERLLLARLLLHQVTWVDSTLSKEFTLRFVMLNTIYRKGHHCQCAI